VLGRVSTSGARGGRVMRIILKKRLVIIIPVEDLDEEYCYYPIIK
jgi:hypothetical protein